MSCYSFWIPRRICAVPLYQLMEELHPRAAVPPHNTKNNMINNKLKVVLVYHFETAGEEKILRIKVQRRATRW